jgi:hypothetical protein
MSALGHKRTFRSAIAMSALPPIATAKADSRKRSCPLYPQERTCAVQLGRSALGQKRTFYMLREQIYFACLDLAAATFAACRWTRCIRGIENEVPDCAENGPKVRPA